MPFEDLSDREGVILVVEDDAQQRMSIHTVLASASYPAIMAEGPAEALRISRDFQGSIPLLVMDVMLQSGDGFHLGQAIRALRPEARVIYMSGLPWEDCRERGMLQPRDAFLPKPFQMKPFLDLIRKTLEGFPSD